MRSVVLIALGAMLLTSCESMPGNFSDEKMMSVHSGMSSDEILAMFGQPQSVSSGVCGAQTSKPWDCTTWKYGVFPDGNANFTFVNDKSGMVLNNFDIDRY